MEVEILAGLLWPHGSSTDAPQVYALLDGARDEAIAPSIQRSQLPYECLYAGTLAPALQAAAPYLVHLAPESRFFGKLVNQGWGRAWGIFVVVEPDVTLKLLRKHFRTLLRVTDEHKRMLLFRFYDPRVLRIYLPTCTAPELASLFGPVSAFVCENTVGDDPVRYQRSARRCDGLSLMAHAM